MAAAANCKKDVKCDVEHIIRKWRGNAKLDCILPEDEQAIAKILKIKSAKHRIYHVENQDGECLKVTASPALANYLRVGLYVLIEYKHEDKPCEIVKFITEACMKQYELCGVWPYNFVADYRALYSELRDKERAAHTKELLKLKANPDDDDDDGAQMMKVYKKRQNVSGYMPEYCVTPSDYDLISYHSTSSMSSASDESDEVWASECIPWENYARRKVRAFKEKQLLKKQLKTIGSMCP